MAKGFSFTRVFQRLLILLFAFLCSCVEPYSIKSISYKSLLAVDGFISADLKQHQVALSTTAPINQPEFIPETGAQVYIKENGNEIPLTEGMPGIYLTPTMQGIVGKTYQLFITTKNGRQLVSEEVTLKYNPEIKDLYATYLTNIPALGNKGGFQILLDTEDSTQQARFYRWEFEETWEITMPFESNYYWLGGNNVMFRTVPISVCYQSDTTGNVIIQSALGLSQDKIGSKVIQTIASDSWKMQTEYSILVRQFTLSANAYLYWQALLTTNQTQGSLSDVQPGTVKGNITSLSDQDQVLGYFDACVVQEKRLFVAPLKFRSSGFVPTEFESNCKFIDYTLVPLDQIGAYYSNPLNANMDILAASGGTLYLFPSKCCDCTSLGTNKKPSFWP